jgi:hypothetical protein
VTLAPSLKCRIGHAFKSKERSIISNLLTILKVKIQREVSICRQGLCSQENGDTSTMAKCLLWFNRTEYVKGEQGRYRMEFGMDPLPKSSIYAF